MPAHSSFFRLAPGPHFSKQFLGGLALILLSAAILRGMQIRESLWLDELHTAWTVLGDGSTLAARAREGNQSPVYFLFPKACSLAFGPQEWSLRLPSLVASLTTIGLLGFAIARLTQSPLAGLFAAWLMAIDRNSWFYAGEARVYALVQLTATIQMLWLLRVVQGGGWRSRLGFVAGNATLFYLHYTAALLWIAEAAYVVGYSVWRKQHARYRPVELGFDLLVMSLLCLPALPQLQTIVARRDNWAVFVSHQPLIALGTLFPISLYVAIAATGCLIEQFGRRLLGEAGPSIDSECPPGAGDSTLRRGDLFAWAIGWFLVPVITAWLLTNTNTARVFAVRYLIGSSPALIVLAALLVAGCQRRATKWIVMTAITMAVVSDAGYLSQYQHDGRFLGDRQQDWRGAIARVNSKADVAGTAVFLRSGLIEARSLPDPLPPALREYLLFPLRGLYRVDVPDPQLFVLPTRDWLPLRGAQRRAVQEGFSAWLIVNSGMLSLEQIRHAWSQELAATGGNWRITVAESYGQVSVVSAERERPAMVAPSASDALDTLSGHVGEQPRSN